VVTSTIKKTQNGKPRKMEYDDASSEVIEVPKKWGE